MSLTAAALLVGGVGLAFRQVLQGRRMLHLLQLEHYENARLFLWARRRGELVTRTGGVVAGLAVAVAVLSVVGVPAWVVPVVVGALLVVVGLAARIELRRAEIKPLVYTRRARRIHVAAMLPAAVVLVAAVIGVLVGARPWPAAVGLLVLAGLTLVPAAVVAFGNWATGPMQRRENQRFVSAAVAKLASVDPLVIGVTGSYGKTTTKQCIGAVLARREPTLVTPASFNSYLGVVRTINEHLEPVHRSFVVEMGMYRAGDIDELCRLVHPRIGVITAIGPAHLERLGSLDAIQNAKAELARALPAGGVLITNADDPRCVAIAASVSGSTVLFGVSSAEAAVRAESIRLQDGRSCFDLVLGAERAEVSARLLGRHNISNLLAAAAVGRAAGMGIEEIVSGLEDVEPPEHRLQPLPNTAAGVVVIDDAYNSNPAGAAAALEVLRDHPAARRILVTPGMVELGAVEEAENERFGELAAAVCDHVILVGPTRTLPIRRGLEAGGLAPAAITVVRDIGGATEVLAGLTRRGDVVLFENDLPDMYAEDGDASVVGASRAT